MLVLDLLIFKLYLNFCCFCFSQLFLAVLASSYSHLKRKTCTLTMLAHCHGDFSWFASQTPSSGSAPLPCWYRGGSCSTTPEITLHTSIDTIRFSRIWISRPMHTSIPCSSPLLMVAWTLARRRMKRLSTAYRKMNRHHLPMNMWSKRITMCKRSSSSSVARKELFKELVCVHVNIL